MTTTELHYRVMPRSRLQHGDLSLRAVDPGDIEAIRQWRNAQMDVLRQSSAITPEAQQRYFAEHVWPEMQLLQPRQILLAIERRGALIGYGGLVHISWQDQRAEISFLLSPSTERDIQARPALLSSFLKLIQEAAFTDLCLLRLWTETYAHRTAHITTLEAAGFQLEGRLRSHIVLAGKRMDSLLHGLLANEWKEQQ